MDMWNWMVECLSKGSEPGPYTYIASQTKKYDVLGLYCAVVLVANVQTPFAYQKKMEEFINAVPRKGESFFTFATRLASAIEVPEQLAHFDTVNSTTLNLFTFFLDDLKCTGPGRTGQPRYW